MDSLEQLNCAIKLTETRKEHVEKAMLSLLAEWRNLETHLDSSTLHDCFIDIQSREARLNEAKQSVTSRNQEINEMRSDLESRREEVDKREKDFERFYEEKCAELGFEERGVEERRREVEGRFEVVRVKERSIENREVKLEVIRKNLVEREKEVERLREEVECIDGSFVSKEKEIEMVEKITHDLRKEFNLQKEKLDLEKKEVDERAKEIELKEKYIKDWVETIDKREKEVNAKNVSSKERCKGVEIREKKLEDRLKQFELKEKRLKETVEAMNLKKKEIELKNVSSEEICRRVEIREKKHEDQLKELELKEKHFKEWVVSMNVKEKDIDLKNASSEERCRKLQIREKKLDDQMKEFDSKEKNVRERVKAFDSGKILSEERCKKLNLMEKKHNELLTEFKLKEQQFRDRVKSFEKKEKEVDSMRLSCEERCRKFELEKKNEFELKEKHFKEWVKTIDLKEKEIDSVWVLNEERCKKLDSMEKTLQEMLTGLKLKEQHENRVKSIEAKEKEVDSIRISCEERCRKFELEKKKLEDQMKESEMKKKQLSKVDYSIVKPELCSVDGSYADIRFSITMGGKSLLLYLINHKRDLDSMTDDIFRALRMSMDPGKLVLNAMQDFYLIIEDKEFEGDVVCKSSILLLEQFRKISPRVQPRLKKVAMELAHKWKNKMNSSGEVIVFLNLLASYRLGSAFDPEEFLSLFEVICQHVQISKLCELLDETDKINLIEVMLKKQQHGKAVKYVCAFGLRDKFQPATLLKDLFKNAEETSNTLRENCNYPVNKKDEAIDNIVASLREALKCIFAYKLESEYSPECMGGFIKQLIQEKEDEKARLSASKNDAEKQEAEKNCKTATVVPDPAEGCITTLTSPFLCNRNALAFILNNMDAISLRVFLSENSEDHEMLGYDIFNVLKLSKEPAKLVLNAIQGLDTPLLETGDEHYESPVVMRSCILLLEQLMKQSLEIEQQVKEDAMKLACDWRAKMSTPVQVLGFLHLISAYGLNSSFEASELEKHFESVSCINHAPELCQVFRFRDNVPNQTTRSSICHWHQKKSSGLEINKKENDETKLIHSENFAKLVLDAIRSCYYSNCRIRMKSFVVKCFIVLLELLLKMSPQIEPHVKKKAAKFALDWKAQLVIVDYNSMRPVEVYGFLNLLAVYKPSPVVVSKELLGFLDRIYLRKNVPELVRLIGLSHKMPDFVKRLIQKGNRIQAIRYIYEFELVGEFSPVPILKDHLHSKKATETSNVPKGNVINRQLNDLREVIKCIKDHQLEVEYPPENLLAQVNQLVEQAKEVTRKETQSYNFTNKEHSASGPEAQTQKCVNKLHTTSGPEVQTRKKSRRKRHAAVAQTQWHVSKHPRIDPPVVTPLNVPFPAFNTMAHLTYCEGAYMQRGPEAQMAWQQTSKLPQIELARASLNVPSPAFALGGKFP